MPKPKRTPAELPSCDMILAAIDRAERHSPGMERGVLLATIKEHLDLPHHSGTTRQLRPKIDALYTLELIEPMRRGGMNLLALTDTGRSQLETASEVRTRYPSPRNISDGAKPARPPPSGSQDSAGIYETHWMKPPACSRPTRQPGSR
jgi:hypothetical protein